jgi:hypothetical protein
MRSYDEMDSYEFMRSNGNYRVLAYMVQPFFESEGGEVLPAIPTMKFVPLENESGAIAAITESKLRYNRLRVKLERQRRARRKGEQLRQPLRQRSLRFYARPKHQSLCDWCKEVVVGVNKNEKRNIIN